MNKGKSKFCGLAATALLAAAVMTSAGIGNFSALAEGEPSKEPVAPERFEAVEALRESGEKNGWSVGVFTGDTLASVSEGEMSAYTYYTTQVWDGYKYAANDNAFAYVPDEMEYTVPTEPDDLTGVPEELLDAEKYGFVLKNDAEKNMALIYTADKTGTLYFQDLAQVAPLHFDDRDKKGVYGEYRILLESAGSVTQVYPAEGAHELLADNAAPTTSAWVNSSVEVKEGDKLIFRSDKADSTIFSSPVVSWEEFEEVYELKNFWKFQQINDANYFEPVYRHNPTDSWLRFPNLETKKNEWDIVQRGGVEMKSSLYWNNDYDFMGAFGGLFMHASGNSASEGENAGKGDIAYAFKVPHNGYVNIDLNLVGNWAAGDFEIVYNGEVLDSCTAAGDTIYRTGLTLSANAVKVTAGTEIYFVQKTQSGGSLKVDMNPIVTYVDAPYTLDKTSIEMDAQEEETLTLTINPDYDLADEEIEWTAANEGIVELTPDGNTVKVKGLAAGQTIISAKIGAYEAVTCEVTINAALQNEFTVDPESLSVKKGESGTLTVTVSDKISVEDIEVAVEDDTIATASLSGSTITVTGVKKGNTKLYITAEGSKSATVEITVTDEGVSTDSSSGSSSDSGKTENDGADGGCGSVVGIGAASVFALGAATFVLTRKKK